MQMPRLLEARKQDRQGLLRVWCVISSICPGSYCWPFSCCRTLVVPTGKSGRRPFDWITGQLTVNGRQLSPVTIQYSTLCSCYRLVQKNSSENNNVSLGSVKLLPGLLTVRNVLILSFCKHLLER